MAIYLVVKLNLRRLPRRFAPCNDVMVTGDFDEPEVGFGSGGVSGCVAGLNC